MGKWPWPPRGRQIILASKHNRKFCTLSGCFGTNVTYFGIVFSKFSCLNPPSPQSYKHNINQSWFLLACIINYITGSSVLLHVCREGTLIILVLCMKLKSRADFQFSGVPCFFTILLGIAES